jgi:hypothetical protein
MDSHIIAHRQPAGMLHIVHYRSSNNKHPFSSRMCREVCAVRSTRAVYDAVACTCHHNASLLLHSVVSELIDYTKTNFNYLNMRFLPHRSTLSKAALRFAAFGIQLLDLSTLAGWSSMFNAARCRSALPPPNYKKSEPLPEQPAAAASTDSHSYVPSLSTRLLNVAYCDAAAAEVSSNTHHCRRWTVLIA